MLVSLFRELPSLRVAIPASTSACLSLARAYIALYRWLEVAGPHPVLGTAETYVALSHQLFEMIYRRLGQEEMGVTERALLTEALYELSAETSVVRSVAQVRACEQSVQALMQLCEDGPFAWQNNDKALSALCQVLESYFYPEAEEDDRWFRFLTSTLKEWCVTLSADAWPGLSLPQAWRRLAVLNRYSYLLRCHQYDAASVRAYHRYEQAMFHVSPSVTLWGSYLEACLPGHLYVLSDEALSRVVESLISQIHTYPLHSDIRLQGLSYAITGLCAMRLRQAMLSPLY